MIKWIRKLFCSHEYKVVREQLVDAGMRKMFIRKCRRCSRERVDFV